MITLLVLNDLGIGPSKGKIADQHYFRTTLLHAEVINVTSARCFLKETDPYLIDDTRYSGAKLIP